MKKSQNLLTLVDTEELTTQAEQLQEAAQALATAMRNQTGKAVTRSAEQAKASATKLAHEARRKVEDKVDEQKITVANRLDNVASVLRRTSKDLHNANEDALAQYTGKAAVQFERLATALRPPQSNSVGARIGRFAKRRPVMFIFTSVAAIAAAQLAIKNFHSWGPMLTSAIGPSHASNGKYPANGKPSTTYTGTSHSSTTPK